MGLDASVHRVEISDDDVRIEHRTGVLIEHRTGVRIEPGLDERPSPSTSSSPVAIVSHNCDAESWSTRRYLSTTGTGRDVITAVARDPLNTLSALRPLRLCVAFSDMTW